MLEKYMVMIKFTPSYETRKKTAKIISQTPSGTTMDQSQLVIGLPFRKGLEGQV